LAQASVEPSQARRSRRQSRSAQSDVQRAPEAAAPSAAGPINLATTLSDIGGASPAEVIALQRTAGNRAVQRLIAQRKLQGKLQVGAANDVYEREADRVAGQVMSSPAPTASSTVSATSAESQSKSQAQAQPSVQRQSAVHAPTPTISPLAQRAPAMGEMNEMGAGFEAGHAIESELSSQAGNGDPLPNNTKSHMEAGFGADFSAVRVHADSKAGQLSRKINAQAFTHGSDIYFGSGKYNPQSASGGHLLAHELTHVVQQSGGAVRRRYQANNKVAAKPALASPVAEAQRNTDNSVQRKLLIGGQPATASVAEGKGLKEMQLSMLKDMVDNNIIKYKFATAENLFAYLRKPTQNDLVEIEQPEMTDDKPSKVKTGAKAIGGGLLGLILSPLTATIGGLAGLVRGGAGGAKSVYNKIGRGRGGGMKFLAGILAIGGALAGAVRGAITGALGGFLAGPVGGALAAAPEMAEEDPETTQNEPKIPKDQLQKGDILLVRGGGGAAGGLIAFGQYLHQLWSGKSRGASAGFRHAGIYLGGSLWAHASGGVFQDAVPTGLVVYRSKSPALAEQATKIAKDWADFRNSADQKATIGYSGGKAGEAIFRSSGYSQTRAAVLAAYFQQGVKPGAMFCSEFAISVYQAAALLPALKGIEAPKSENKGEIKDWAKSNKDRIGENANTQATKRGQAGSPSGGLAVDPRRTGPQMLAAELHRQSTGEDPTWEYKGISE